MPPQNIDDGNRAEDQRMRADSAAPAKMGRFRASWMIVRGSWQVLRQDTEMMWFPVLAFVGSLIALAALVFVLFSAGLAYLPAGDGQTGAPQMDWITLVVLFVFYVVVVFISNFSTACILVIAHGRFRGTNLTFADGVRGALSCVDKIFIWSAIGATVGFLLGQLEQRSKLLGKIVAYLLGAAWNLMTYFGLPSLVVGRRSVADAFRESAALIRKTWGETVIIHLGVGLVHVALLAAGLMVVLALVFFITTWMAVLVLFGLYLVYVVGVSIVFTALSAIFKLALYEYAVSGSVPSGFSPELMQNAIKKS